MDNVSNTEGTQQMAPKRLREFEEGARAYRYAHQFGGFVVMLTPAGQPHFYVVVMP